MIINERVNNIEKVRALNVKVLNVRHIIT
jgi:hypothetical protein